MSLSYLTSLCGYTSTPQNRAFVIEEEEFDVDAYSSDKTACCPSVITRCVSRIRDTLEKTVPVGTKQRFIVNLTSRLAAMAAGIGCIVAPIFGLALGANQLLQYDQDHPDRQSMIKNDTIVSIVGLGVAGTVSLVCTMLLVSRCGKGIAKDYKEWRQGFPNRFHI